MPHLRPSFSLAILVLALLVSTNGFSQKDNYKKNDKIYKAEKARYEKDLKEHPNSAEPHWRHANIVGLFKFKEAEEAWKYYNKALDIDSTNAKIWSDFGDYVVRVYQDERVALNMYEKALALEPENEKFKTKVIDLTKTVEQIEETIRLRSLGSSDRRKVDHDIRYSVVSNFDSLQTIVTSNDASNSYENLLGRFLKDDLLSEWETYLLCLGYAATDDYSPYSDSAGELYEYNQAGNYGKTIERGNDLLKKNPVSAALYRELMYAHRRKGENEIADRYQRRSQRLFEAMIFTGDGSCEKPYITLTTTDEYMLINYLGFYSLGEQALMSCNGNRTDRLSVEDRDAQKDHLYFDVSLLFLKLRKSFTK